MMSALLHTMSLSLAAATPPAGDAVHVSSVWDFVVKGGPMMIPIGLCSIIALAVAAERMVALRRSTQIPKPFLREFKSTLEREGAGAALKLCNRNDTPVAHVFAAGVRSLGEGPEVIERRVQDAGEREAITLRKRLRALAVIASVTPLMGLLGTIFGMIEAFQTVATAAESLGQAELLAGGIYEAMITTAAGLVVAIPTLLVYHWLSARVDGLVLDLDRAAVDFVERVGVSSNGAVTAASEERLKRTEASA